MASIDLHYPLVLLLLPLLWGLLIVVAWRRRFKPFGAFLLRLLIIVLAVVALSRPVMLPDSTPISNRDDDDQSVMLIDQSASISEQQQQIFRTEATKFLQRFPKTKLLYFSDQAILVPSQTITDINGMVALSTPLNPEMTNLRKAISVGAEMLGSQSGRLVLFSDGLSTEGDMEAWLPQFAQQEIPIDVFQWDQEQTPNEMALVELDVPTVLRAGGTFEIGVVIHTAAAAEVNLNLSQNESVLAEDVVTLEPGFNRFSFEEVEVEEVGSHTFQAEVIAVDPTTDIQKENNQFSAFSQVYPPPQILVVGENSTDRSQLSHYLQEAGFEPHTIEPADLPHRLSALEPFDSMVLVDVAARSFTLDQMLAVQEFVRSLGRGLLITGGRSSFSLGGYENTPLAEVSPVLMDPPSREERPPVALLLIVDHSGSMLERGAPATKLAMAKEAAIRATDILGPQDLIGVLMFDNRYEWVVPFQSVSDGAELLAIQQNIASIPGGGGTQILQALEIGLPALAAEETETIARHAVLFSDGKSFDGGRGISDYNLVVDEAREAGITLSTIAIGQNADGELLAYLAEQGLGRYHIAETPEELPALTIAESDILRSNAVQEDEYLPSVSGPHPILRGLEQLQGDELDIPPLKGYIALTPKPRTEVVLQIGPEDPLLSVWGYGLGRVAAWSTDIGQEWAEEWQDETFLTQFWSQVADYTLPRPDLGPLQISTEMTPDKVVTIIAEGVTASGQTVDLAPTQAVLILPGGEEKPFTLRQIAPGRYQQRVQLTEAGAYQLIVTQSRPEAENQIVTTGFVLPYSAEYRITEAGEGSENLSRLAEATGGQQFSLSESLTFADCSSELDGNCQDALVSSIQNPMELWPWLLQLALILWPIEIAWRRWGRLRIQ